MSLRRKLQRSFDRSVLFGARTARDGFDQIATLHLTAATLWCIYTRILARSPLDDHELRRAIRDTAKALSFEMKLSEADSRELVSQALHFWSEQSSVKYLARTFHDWYEHAMPTLQVQAELAASLMCTHAPQLLADFRMPFPVVMVDIPADVIVMDSEMGKVSMRHACLARGDDYWLISAWDATMGKRILGSDTDLMKLLEGPERIIPESSADAVMPGALSHPAAGYGAAETRAVYMLIQLVVNACLMMTSSDAATCVESRVSHPYSRRRQGPPERRFYRFTRPVVHDVRKAVQDYIAHGGKAPTVQSVVAGHWKMQVHGAGRTERKRIFVEPYWRGPEDAPIALRPHVLKDSRAQ